MQRRFRVCTGLLVALLSAGCSSSESAESAGHDEAEGPTAVTMEPIIGGTAATAYPEAAVLDIDKGATGTWYACSGTLVAPRVVLTAGHCVDGHKQWGVYVKGEYRLATSAKTYDWAENGAELVNPQHHDLGLVFFDQPITIATYPTLSTTLAPNGTKALNIGRINSGTFTSSSYEAPATISSAALIGYPFDYVSTDVIQPGDSGGAVMVSGTHTLVAVNSGAGGGIQVLARVDLLADWLKSEIAAHAPASAPPASSPKPDGDAGAPPAAPVEECAMEKEPDDELATAFAMKKCARGSLATATDVDWMRFTLPVGTSSIQLTATSDATLLLGQYVSGRCALMTSSTTLVNVTVSGGAVSLCARISSAAHKSQTYALAVK